MNLQVAAVGGEGNDCLTVFVAGYS